MSSSSETARALVLLFGGVFAMECQGLCPIQGWFCGSAACEELTTPHRLPFTLTSVLFLHNK